MWHYRRNGVRPSITSRFLSDDVRADSIRPIVWPQFIYYINAIRWEETTIE